MFQRPERASFISTAFKRVSIGRIKFQRPERASLISTVPSETPHKHWLSGLVFAGIYLKILIISIFYLFSGMFTICSYFKTFPTAEIILQFSFD